MRDAKASLTGKRPEVGFVRGQILAHPSRVRFSGPVRDATFALKRPSRVRSLITLKRPSRVSARIFASVRANRPAIREARFARRVGIGSDLAYGQIRRRPSRVGAPHGANYDAYATLTGPTLRANLASRIAGLFARTNAKILVSDFCVRKNTTEVA